MRAWALPAAACWLFGLIPENFPHRRLMILFAAFSVWGLASGVRHLVVAVGAKRKPTQAVAAVVWSGLWTLTTVVLLIGEIRRPATTLVERTIVSADVEGELPSRWRVGEFTWQKRH